MITLDIFCNCTDILMHPWSRTVMMMMMMMMMMMRAQCGTQSLTDNGRQMTV